MMTREEAIELLEDLDGAIEDNHGRDYDEVFRMAVESLSAESVQLKQTDTLIIADALQYLALDTERHLSDRTRADSLREQILKYGASMCHSADVVEVVRCKDCKHWKNEHLCLAWSRFGSVETKADQFCSYGERREP